MTGSSTADAWTVRADHSLFAGAAGIFFPDLFGLRLTSLSTTRTTTLPFCVTTSLFSFILVGSLIISCCIQLYIYVCRFVYHTNINVLYIAVTMLLRAIFLQPAASLLFRHDVSRTVRQNWPHCLYIPLYFLRRGERMTPVVWTL